MVVGFYQSDCRQNVCTIQLVFDQKYYHISPFWALAFWKTQIKENLMKTWGKKCNIKKCDFSISLRKTLNLVTFPFKRLNSAYFCNSLFTWFYSWKKPANQLFSIKNSYLYTKINYLCTKIANILYCNNNARNQLQCQ